MYLVGLTVFVGESTAADEKLAHHTERSQALTHHLQAYAESKQQSVSVGFVNTPCQYTPVSFLLFYILLA
ncbi:hypothetical protein ACX27_18590 [Nostoc piscinale CENA21]|uniref:Uncharacterized protein n=1 Tax=Nostoc piscinale CENA21 TaxID=224013 RepID=A0A0M4T5S3_9NOSO|nr:hypothetical protein ACX27_18590 [Nostoc piscinale CENA21]